MTDAMGVVIDRAGQPRGDEEDVVDRRGASDAQVVERGDNEAACGQVVRHAVVGIAFNLKIEVPGRTLAAGETAQEDRRGRRTRSDGARIQPLRVKVPGNGTHSETSTETAVVVRSPRVCSLAERATT